MCMIVKYVRDSKIKILLQFRSYYHNISTSSLYIFVGKFLSTGVISTSGSGRNGINFNHFDFRISFGIGGI